MADRSSQGLLADSLKSPGRPAFSPGQSKEISDVRYNRVPANEAGYPSPAFSSPGLSSLPSPGPFKSLEEVKTFSDMKQSDAVLKHRIRILKFLLRLATLLLALYMIATMSLTFHKFFTTRNHMIAVPDGQTGSLKPRGPWAKQTKTWPTTVLLVTSTISFLVSAVVMAAYVRGVRAANAAHEYGSYLGFGTFAAHVGMWIAVAVAYRAGKDGNDLWGWTCDDRATKIQQPFAQVINFKRYCDIQTSSWITSLAQAVLMVLSLAVYLWGYRRLKHQREMGSRFTPDVYEHREGRWSKFVPTKH